MVSKQAQGTIEYLVIMAVIIVIGLLVVGMTSTFLDSSSGISSGVGGLSSIIGPISISETVLDSEGDGLSAFTNNSGETLIITKIVLGSVDNNYNETVTSGGSVVFGLSDLVSGCTCTTPGEARTCSMTVYYTSVNGIPNSATKSVTVDCVGDANIDSGVVSPIDLVAPAVSLSGPASGSQDVDRAVTFLFSASDNVALARCDLYLNGVFDQSISSFGTLEFSESFTQDILVDWNVYCVDSSDNGTWSGDTFSLDVDANEYQLTTCVELQEIENDLSGSYDMMNDINCYSATREGGALYKAGAGFSPLGASSPYFNGDINGNGKIISSLKINRPVGSEVGLIGIALDGTSVSMLGLNDINYIGQSGVGGIIGSITQNNSEQITIESVFTKGYIKGEGDVGGIVGAITGNNDINPDINNAYNEATIISDDLFAGGIIGLMSYSSSIATDGNISYVYNAGQVLMGGGVIGADVYGSPYLRNSFSVGLISTGSGSGLINYNQDDKADNVYWDIGSTGQSTCGYDSVCTSTNDVTAYYGASGIPFSTLNFDTSKWTAQELGYPKFVWED